MKLKSTQAEVDRLIGGCTPAKLVDIVRHLIVVEMMVAMQKMRIRRRPENYADITNRTENPALLAADAAETALRGFVEEETTVGVSLYAPLNAIALLVGSQIGRGGVKRIQRSRIDSDNRLDSSTRIQYILQLDSPSRK